MRELSDKERFARDKICFPLDGIKSINEAKEIIEDILPVIGMFKIGKESFTRFGIEIVRLAQSYQRKVFLDLKYHDIPHTVRGTAKAACELGVYMFDVHASGGFDMMKAARDGVKEAAAEGYNEPKIIAVTVLTSIDEEILNNELSVSFGIEEHVLSLARLAEKAEMDGIVCSAGDVPYIKDKLSANFMYVTPGIMGVNSKAGYDQKRIFTPDAAIKAGADILVIGRAISQAEDKIQAGLAIIEAVAASMV